MSYLKNVENKLNEKRIYTNTTNLFISGVSAFRQILINPWSHSLFQYPTYIRPIQKGFITVLERDMPIIDILFQFNPNEIEENISSSYSEHVIPGLPYPILQFINGNTKKMSFTLLFDSSKNLTAQGWEARGLANAPTIIPTEIIFIANRLSDIYASVQEPIEKYNPVEEVIIYLKQVVNPDSGFPKIIIFNYGKIEFKSVIQNMTVKRIRFDKDGDCTRTTITLTLISYVDVDATQALIQTSEPGDWELSDEDIVV